MKQTLIILALLAAAVLVYFLFFGSTGITTEQTTTAGQKSPLGEYLANIENYVFNQQQTIIKDTEREEYYNNQYDS